MEYYNIDEILLIAKKIERNGRKFYLAAAASNPDNADWLTRLADDETRHEQMFENFRHAFAEESGERVEDPEDLAQGYLYSIANNIVFKLAEDPTAKLTEETTLKEILVEAVAREHEAVLFYTGIRDAVADERVKKQVELVIGEEMRHAAMLSAKLRKVESQVEEKDASSVYDLAIIGAGPGGISMAAECIEAGVDPKRIIVLEGTAKTSWMIRKLYPEQKLVTASYKGSSPETFGVMTMRNMTKDSVLQMLSETAADYGIRVRYETPVHAIEKKEGIFHLASRETVVKAKCCVVAIGVFGRPQRPDYRIPRPVLTHVHFDVTGRKITDSNVLVVGGGDSAADYVHHLLQEGNNLILSSREADLSFMNDDNRRKIRTLAEASKIRLLAGSEVAAVAPQDNAVEVTFKTAGVDPIVVDRIVYAIGGTTPMNFLQIAGIEMDGRKPHVTDTNETNIPGLYLTGDLAARDMAGAITTAFNASHFGAKDLVKRYLAP